MNNREKALERIKQMQKRGYCKQFKEVKSKEKIWVCVVYHSNTRGFEEEKKLVIRILNGEKIKCGAYFVELFLGYGKLLGIEKEKTYKAYVLYDVVTLIGEKEPVDTYHTFHEGWVKLGNWAKSKRLDVLKERVVFT